MSRAVDTDAEPTVPVDALAEGDIVVFRGPWLLEERPAFGVVREGGADGPRVASPRFPDRVARLASSLAVERVSAASSLLGVDTSGASHVVHRGPLRAKWGRPGELETYPLAAEGRSVAEWIQHVAQKRGWAEPGRDVRAVLEGGDRE